jgi:hypothetical protein
MSIGELRVESNTPRLLERDEAPPPSTADPQLPPEVPERYWTPDKASHVVARLLSAGSKFYGPSFKAAEWELDLISDPAAAVMNDWLPLRVGASGDKQANLIALVVVVIILVLFRLPDVLEQHGVIKAWRPPQERLREQQQQQAAQSAPPAAAPAQPSQAVVETPAERPSSPFEPQLVGSGAVAASSSDKLREQVYGGGTVGGGRFVEMPE